MDYLRERQPALDYTSLDALSCMLGMRFWADIEEQHPGIQSLRLPREVTDGWKRRLRTITKMTTNEVGEKVQVAVPRINYRECLKPVRAFYLDLAHWAVEQPSRWSLGGALSRRGRGSQSPQGQRQRKSRMDSRTRERLPALPILVRNADQQRSTAMTLLEAARGTQPGQSFTPDSGTAPERCIRSRPTTPVVSILAHPTATDPVPAHASCVGRRRPDP